MARSSLNVFELVDAILVKVENMTIKFILKKLDLIALSKICPNFSNCSMVLLAKTTTLLNFLTLFIFLLLLKVTIKPSYMPL
jgi:hypothetical protein